MLSEYNICMIGIIEEEKMIVKCDSTEEMMELIFDIKISYGFTMTDIQDGGMLIKDCKK